MKQSIIQITTNVIQFNKIALGIMHKVSCTIIHS